MHQGRRVGVTEVSQDYLDHSLPSRNVRGLRMLGFT
jgi:hypothetical protein